MTEENQSLRAEHDIVRKLRSGDHNAFEETFFYYCKPLVSFAYRIIQDQSVAENIVQDVFLKVWQNREDLDPTASFKSYLYTAVKNQAYNHLRHDAVVERNMFDSDDEGVVTETPEESWTRKELGQAIAAAVDELPKGCRTIFSMHRYDNLSYREIAEILNISLKTVETQMGRSLKKLRRRLGHLLQVLFLLILTILF